MQCISVLLALLNCPRYYFRITVNKRLPNSTRSYRILMLTNSFTSASLTVTVESSSLGLKLELTDVGWFSKTCYCIFDGSHLLRFEGVCRPGLQKKYIYNKKRIIYQNKTIAANIILWQILQRQILQGQILQEQIFSSISK